MLPDPIKFIFFFSRNNSCLRESSDDRKCYVRRLRFAICTSPIMHLIYPHSFLLGPLKYPGEIKNRDYANFWGAKKVYYGRCKNGEWNLKQREWVTTVTFSLMTLWWLSFRPFYVLTTTSFINASESQSLQSAFVSLFWFPVWNGKRHISGTCRRSTKGRDKFTESESYFWKHFLSVISFRGSTCDIYLHCTFIFVKNERVLSPCFDTTWITH